MIRIPKLGRENGNCQKMITVHTSPMRENQTEKNMEKEMGTVGIQWCIWIGV